MQTQNLEQFRYLKPAGRDKYSSACPKCGGEPHRNGELPDRFRIWMHSKTTGDILGWCRQCGHIWTPQNKPLDPITQKKWIEERRNYEEEEKLKIEHALELLQKEHAWVKYNENLTDELKEHYYKRNINDYFIAYWMLGYNPKKVIWDGAFEHETPALTIPVFEPVTQKVLTIRNRLLNPIREGDKYRPEFGGLPATLYYTDYDRKPINKALIVEGEFKAMTTYIALDNPDMFVVGVPGKMPSLEILSAFENCEVVYLLLDPDAYIKQQNAKTTAIQRMIDYFQDRARIIQLPYKVDDMILSMGLGKKNLESLLQTARKIKWQPNQL